MPSWHKGNAMHTILFSLLPLLFMGTASASPQKTGKRSQAKSEKNATFDAFEFQIPSEWLAAKPEGKKIRWTLQGKRGMSLSISMGPLETKLSPQQYLMDRMGRLGDKTAPKYYGGDSTGIPFLGLEFDMQAGKNKTSLARALVAIFKTNKGLIRFVATGDKGLFLLQRPKLKRILFTFRAKGKPLPQRLPSPKQDAPRSRPSTISKKGTSSRPSKDQALPASALKKGWLKTKVADLTISYPQAWIKTKPSNNMRLLELHLKGEKGEGVLTAYYFGPSSGSIRMNLDRWKGQFSDPKNIMEKEIKGAHLPTTLLSLDGNYGGGMGGVKAKGRSRLFAWITRTSKGPFYFKLVAPKKTVDTWEQNLLEVAKLIR